MDHEREKPDFREKKADLNFRPVLFCALGLAFGIFLYGKIRYGGLLPSDFLLVGLIGLLALRPLSVKRLAALFLTIACSAGIGALGIFAYAQSFEAETREGSVALTGTAVSVSQKGGYSIVILDDLFADGGKADGKCRLFLQSEDVLPADRIAVFADLSPLSREEIASDGTARYDFSQNIRYSASCKEFEKTGLSSDPFLRFNRLLYESLFENMDRDTAGVAYALLTGNSGNMDAGFSDRAQRGGIVHIFAVSGLHVGILYSAVYFLFRPLKRYRFLPAVAAAFFQCALCNFTASSVRAFLMCAALGISRFFGKKYDYINSVSLAAALILLFSPRQWFSWGFRLTFGACAGIGLFSGSFTRLFRRLKFPRAAGKYLSGYLGVQLFIFPLQMEMAGFFPVWGLFFNLLIVPFLPVLLSELFICSALALIIPPAAPALLSLPGGMIGLLFLLLSSAGAVAVLKGFSLGAGSAVWIFGCLFLSERVRASVRAKAVAAAALVCLFSAALVFENAVFDGCKIEVCSHNGGTAALVSTDSARVLLLDGDISLDRCEDFLSRSYGGVLDAVVVLSSDPLAAVNRAAFLPAKAMYAQKPFETGFAWQKVTFGERFSCGELSFCYLSEEKLLMTAEGLAVEVDFDGEAALGADLYLGEARGNLKYFLKDGKIYS